MGVKSKIYSLFERIGRKLFRRYYAEKDLYDASSKYFHARTGKSFSYKQVSSKSNITEKLFWLHRYWQHPLIVQCADKYRMREYVKECGLDHILVPLLGAYDDANEIDFDGLPNQFVLKCNHGCGYNIICTDKSKLDIDATKRKLNTWMKEVYGLNSFELHYSKIEPKIISEEYLDFSYPENAIDYKIHCINGEPYCFLLCFDRDYVKGGVELASYSVDWEKKDYLKQESIKSVAKPAELEQMLEYARILSKPFPYVRVDLYCINKSVLVGELTFTPAGSIMDYYKDSTLEAMGEALKLPRKYRK